MSTNVAASYADCAGEHRTACNCPLYVLSVRLRQCTCPDRQVFVDGLRLAIDNSDASCSTLRYDSGSGTVSCTNAQATIVFKARQ